MKTITRTILFLLVFSYITLFAQNTVIEEWTYRYNGTDSLTDAASAIDARGCIVIAGSTQSVNSGKDFIIQRYSPSGILLVSATYNGPDNGNDVAVSVLTDDNCNIIVTGYSWSASGQEDWLTLTLDSLLNIQYEVRYDGTANGNDRPFAMVLDASGNVFITGYSTGIGTGFDYTTIMYNSQVSQQWVSHYDGGSALNDISKAIVLSGTEVIITGYSTDSLTNRDFATVKYDITGTELWVNRYTSTGNKPDEATGIDIDAQGNIYVCGFNYTLIDHDYTTIKYSPAGVQQWIRKYNSGDQDQAFAIVVNKTTSEIYVTGWNFTLPSHDIATVKYDSSGTQLWVKKYNGPAGEEDGGNDITLDDSGNVYVCGFSKGIGTDFDYATIKYTSSGNEVWVMRYNGAGNSSDVAVALSLDKNNNVYVTGSSMGGVTIVDIVTIKYNQSPTLSLVFNITDESCAGAEDGAIDLTVSNGVLPYSFSWSNGQTTEDIFNLPAGEYFVIVTDSNNFTVSGTAVVNTIPPDSTSAANTPPPCSELFISEYSEGTGQNKALEIYNPTPNPILLNRYIVRVFMNGAPTPLLNQLIGTLQPYSTHVIAHPNASLAITSKAQQTSQKLNFNGDDAIQLIKINNDININIDSIEGIGQNPHTLLNSLDLDTLDLLGIPYVDPGNQGFPVGSGTTKNSTLIRNVSVTSGIPDWNCGQKQWRVYAVDSIADLGSHQNICQCTFANLNHEFFYAPNGNPVFVKDQLIVRFDTSAVIRESIDNSIGNKTIECASISYFIKPNAVTKVNQKLIGISDTAIGSIRTFKIFQQLKTTDTKTISRLGDTIQIPPFWATFLLVFPEGTDISRAADSLNSLFPLVIYTQPNLAIALLDSADDTEYPTQASLHSTTSYDTAHINIETAWNFETGKPFVKVGVFDTGIDWDHEDFGNGTASGSKVVDGWNFQNNTPLKSTTNADANGHGTACAGIIGAIRNNSKGIAGIAGGNDVGLSDLSDKGSALYGMRIIDPPFNNIFNYIADAIVTSSIEDTSKNYAYGLNIMSNSWRIYENFTQWFTDTNILLLTEAVHFANRAKVTFAAARGNEGYVNQAYPAIIDDDWVLCVGGTGTNGDYIHTWPAPANGEFTASRGWEIDLGAPASNLLVKTVKTGGGYKTFNGTSAATPHVAGVAALLMSYLNSPTPSYGNLAPEDIEAVLQMTAKDNNIGAPYFLPGVDSLCGYGLLNAGAALQLVDLESRRLSHYSTDAFANNKSKTLISTQDTIMLLERYQNFAGTWFLPGKYIVNSTYRIDATVFHNLTMTDSIISYWPRPSSSNLLQLFDAEKKLLPRERVTINSLNKDSASLSGHLYFVTDTLGNPLGWWPFYPTATLSEVDVAYSILRHDTLFSNIQEPVAKIETVSIYPNPSQNRVTIIITSDKSLSLKICLYDIRGSKIKDVFQGKSGLGKNFIACDINSLSPSIYFFEINLGNETIRKRFIKQ